MRPFRFLHAADLHLDSPFRGLTSLPAMIRDRVITAIDQALKQLIAIAIQERVDFVVISGDIYDASSRSLRAQMMFQAAMSQLAEHRIQAFIVHGNHDPVDGEQARLMWPESVHFFSAKHVEMKHAYDRAGHVVAHVYGMSYATAAITDNLALQYKVSDVNAFNIALLHCNVDGNQAHEPYAPCTKQQLIDSQMDYWALGHVHSRQVLHTYPHIVYPGNLQGRHARERDIKGCYIVDVTERGEVLMTFQRTDVFTWFHESISIANMQTEQDLKDACDALIERVRAKAEGRSAMLRITWEGYGEVHDILQQDANRQALIDLFHHREIVRVEAHASAPFVWIESMQLRTGRAIDVDKLLEQNSFLGEMLRLSQQMSAQPEQLAHFVKEALEPLLTHRQASQYLKNMSLETMEQWLRRAEQLALEHWLEDEG